MEGILKLTDTIYHKSIKKTLKQGAGLGFILSLLFITMMRIIAGEWMILPVLTSIVGGVVGGFFFYILVQKWDLNKWQKILLTIIGLTVFLIIFWISLVLGFAITGHWD